MFKRTNKLTALLVAAAAVVAVVPTTANAAERLGSKEGNLTSGYSYAEGKYVYDARFAPPIRFAPYGFPAWLFPFPFFFKFLKGMGCLPKEAFPAVSPSMQKELTQKRDVLIGEIIKRFVLINRLVYFAPQ